MAILEIKWLFWDVKGYIDLKTGELATSPYPPLTKSNHMMYGSRGIEWDRQSFFVILGHFLPFYPEMILKIKTLPLTKQKIKISKQWKKLLEMSSFYRCVPQIMITWCTVSKIWCMVDRQTIEETEKVTYRRGWGREYGIPLFR